MYDIEAANNQIDNFVNEIYRLREPITPTKEQIDFIRRQINLLSTPLEDIPVMAIEIWEKIRGGEK